MTMYDYLMLNEHSQALTLALKGEYVATCDNGNTEFVLYSLSTFFLELEKDKITEKMVGRQIFQSGRQLDKYLPESFLPFKY